MAKVNLIRQKISELLQSSNEFAKKDLLDLLPNEKHLIEYTLKKDVADGILVKIGNTRGAKYIQGNQGLVSGAGMVKTYKRKNKSEEEIFEDFREGFLNSVELNENAQNIIVYAFTEMVNNAIDHSQSDIAWLAPVWFETDATAPFSITWDTTDQANGNVQLLGYAYDMANNRGISPVISVTVDNPVVEDTSPPEVFILSPSATNTVSGTVNIDISAQDNIGIALVKCYVDDVLKGTTTADTLSCSWNTRKATVGLHTIRATAEDTAGLVSSTEIQVDVVSTTKGGGGGGGTKGGGKGRNK